MFTLVISQQLSLIHILFEMKAYIYNDEKGDNITVTDDLGDMADQAAEYRTELIEKHE